MKTNNVQQQIRTTGVNLGMYTTLERGHIGLRQSAQLKKGCLKLNEDKYMQ